MPLVTLTDGRSFEAKVGSTILDAARQSGLVLAHGCTTGRCGACRVRVMAGDLAPCGVDSVVDEVDRADGWRLACVSSAERDVTLSAVPLDDLSLAPPRMTPARIEHLERLRDQVLLVRLRVPPGDRLPYRAGQYVDVSAPGGQVRSYSLACAPRDDARLELHVRYVPGGAMSQWWFEEARVGALVRLRGPLGTAVLRPLPVGGRHVFLVTGTGLAPAKAMLETLAAEPTAGTERPLLLWGGRVPADHYLDVDSLPAEVVRVCSRADAAWTGANGYVQHVAAARGDIDWARASVHACGAPPMIAEARRVLLARGLAPHAFHADAFTATGPVSRVPSACAA